MINVGVYQTPKYTAYIYPKNIVVVTKYQAFRIANTNPKDRIFLDELALDLIHGRIQSFCDLRDFNGALRYTDTAIPSMA